MSWPSFKSLRMKEKKSEKRRRWRRAHAKGIRHHSLDHYSTSSLFTQNTCFFLRSAIKQNFVHSSFNTPLSCLFTMAAHIIPLRWGLYHRYPPWMLIRQVETTSNDTVWLVFGHNILKLWHAELEHLWHNLSIRCLRDFLLDQSLGVINGIMLLTWLITAKAGWRCLLAQQEKKMKKFSSAELEIMGWEACDCECIDCSHLHSLSLKFVVISYLTRWQISHCCYLGFSIYAS